MPLKKSRKRNIVKLKDKSITKFPAQKSSSSKIALESPLERDFCYHLEFDQDVVSYEPQPEGYEYVLDGELRFYTPDFEVFFGKPSSYYEVKFRDDIEGDAEFDHEFAAKSKAAQDLGKDLVLVTDEFIARRYRYENLCLLYKSVDLQIDKQFLDHVTGLMSECSQQSIGKLLRESSWQDDFFAVHKLIWTKQLLADLDSEVLSTQSLVSLGDWV